MPTVYKQSWSMIVISVVRVEENETCQFVAPSFLNSLHPSSFEQNLRCRRTVGSSNPLRIHFCIFCPRLTSEVTSAAQHGPASAYGPPSPRPASALIARPSVSHLMSVCPLTRAGRPPQRNPFSDTGHRQLLIFTLSPGKDFNDIKKGS